MRTGENLRILSARTPSDYLVLHFLPLSKQNLLYSIRPASFSLIYFFLHFISRDLCTPYIYWLGMMVYLVGRQLKCICVARSSGLGRISYTADLMSHLAVVLCHVPQEIRYWHIM